MKLRDKLQSFLLRRYSPTGIILHGSRARCDHDEDSDWDFYLICDVARQCRWFTGEILWQCDQSLDICPVPEEPSSLEIAEKFDNTLIGAQCLFDSTGFVSRLLGRAAVIYSQPRCLSARESFYRREVLVKLAGRLDRHQNCAPLFQLVESQFFRLAYRAWYEQLHDEWPKSARDAISEIAQRDRGFHKLLMKFTERKSMSQRARVAGRLINRLASKRVAVP